MAEVRAYAEQCPVGGGIIHLGATSTDVEDNADVLASSGSDGPPAGATAVALLAHLAEQIESRANQPSWDSPTFSPPNRRR